MTKVKVKSKQTTKRNRKSTKTAIVAPPPPTQPTNEYTKVVPIILKDISFKVGDKFEIKKYAFTNEKVGDRLRLIEMKLPLSTITSFVTTVYTDVGEYSVFYETEPCVYHVQNIKFFNLEGKFNKDQQSYLLKFINKITNKDLF